MCKFEEKGLKKILDDLERKNWLNNFDEKEKEDFIKKVCELEFTSPEKDDVFNAFKIGENDNIIKPENVRILIIGQDPYPNPQKAQGLAFSHKKWDSIDASLLNIYKAIKAYKDNCKFNEVDTKVIKGEDGSNPWNTNIEMWAKNNGVFLLNTALTYEETDLHKNIDKKTKKQKNEIKNKQKKLIKKHQAVWKTFIKNTIIKLFTCNSDKLVVFLWGADAQNLFFECINSFGINNCAYNLANKTDLLKRGTINITRKILCLITSHPSNTGGAVKRGFREDAPNHFKACDEFLFGKYEAKYVWKNFPKNNPKKINI